MHDDYGKIMSFSPFFLLSHLLCVNTSVKSTLKSLKKTKTQIKFGAMFVLSKNVLQLLCMITG